MNRFFVVFIFLAFANNTWAESLSEIYAAALQNDYRFKSAQFGYLADQEIKNISRADFLPVVNADGVLTHSETTTELNSSNPLAIKSTQVQRSRSPGYSISLTQSLIDVTAIHNYRRSELLGRLAALELESAKSSLVFRTADAYLKILRADAKFVAAQSSEAAYRQQLEVAKKKFNVGLVRMSDVIETQSRSDAALADVLIAKNNVGILFEYLEVITGNNYAQLAALSDGFVASLPVPMDLKQWIDAAEKNNIDINIAKLKTDEVYQKYQANKSEHLPKLTGRLSYSDSYKSNKYNDAIPDRLYNEGVSASLILTVPLYNGGRLSASARQANYDYLESQNNSNNTNREVVQATHSIYLSTVAGVSVINARKTAIRSSQAALDYAKRGYEEGVRNIIDVLDAQNIFYRANQDYADAVYEYLIAGLKLKEMAGVLSVRDIEELDLQLDQSKKVHIPALN